jgi:hypothetical protein
MRINYCLCITVTQLPDGCYRFWLFITVKTWSVLWITEWHIQLHIVVMQANIISSRSWRMKQIYLPKRSVLSVEYRTKDKAPKLSTLTTRYSFSYHDYDHASGMRLRLWTLATNGPTVHLQVNMSVDNHGGMISTVENSWFLHQSSLAILPA